MFNIHILLYWNLKKGFSVPYVVSCRVKYYFFSSASFYHSRFIWIVSTETLSGVECIQVIAVLVVAFTV